MERWQTPSLAEAAVGPAPGRPWSYCPADVGNRHRPRPETAARGRSSCPSCSRRTTCFPLPQIRSRQSLRGCCRWVRRNHPVALNIDFHDLVGKVSAGRMILDAPACDHPISPLGPIAGDGQRFTRSWRFGGQRQRLRLRTLDGQGGKIPITIGLQQQGPTAKTVGKDHRNRPCGIADNVPIGHDEAMRSIGGHQCPRAQRRTVLFGGDNSYHGRMGSLYGRRNWCRPNRGNRRTKRDQNRQEFSHATHCLSGERDNLPGSFVNCRVASSKRHSWWVFGRLSRVETATAY